MIDDPEATDLLYARLKAALPLPARPTPELLALLREKQPAMTVTPACRIVALSYAGDEGSIVCKLDFGADRAGHAAFVSITHLPPICASTRACPSRGRSSATSAAG